MFPEAVAAFRVTPERLDTTEVARAVAAPGCGAVTTFVGLVRDHNAGRRVLWLDYEAYEPLAIRTFEQIAAEGADRWADVRLAIHHRTGRLDVGGLAWKQHTGISAVEIALDGVAWQRVELAETPSKDTWVQK